MTNENYSKIDDEMINRIINIVGKDRVMTKKDEMMDYSHDEFIGEDIQQFPEVVVKPPGSEAISRIMKFCNEERIPLTPRGGGTGLCGGCVPVYGGIVMSFENMKTILEIDKENLMVTAEAGVRLAEFYACVEGEGLFFPPHPGDESATIGGVISTNAGGARAVKYGVIRNFVKGIEVVLPDGEIVNLGGKYLKNSSGYNLMHLMIGSEGTLGIVTKAIIGLMTPPKVTYTLVAPFPNLHDAINTVPSLIKNNILLMAIEFVDRITITMSGKYIQKTWPFGEGDAQLIMIVEGRSFDDIVQISEDIHKICLENHAIDVYVADTSAQQRDILKIRSSIYEALKAYSLEILDISVPRAEIARFVDDVKHVEHEFDTWLPTYGHAADGNVHTHIMRFRWEDEEWKEIEGWKEKYSLVRTKLHELGKRYKGICSGEHGIGFVKKEYLNYFLEKKQIEIMRKIKMAFDPNHILNPGKVIDISGF